MANTVAKMLKHCENYRLVKKADTERTAIFTHNKTKTKTQPNKKITHKNTKKPQHFLSKNFPHRRQITYQRSYFLIKGLTLLLTLPAIYKSTLHGTDKPKISHKNRA